MNEPSSAIKLFPVEELPDGKIKRVEHSGNAILLCRVGKAVFAVDDMCTHEDISLSLGVLCEHRLRCPLHGSEFDIRTGKVLTEPAEIDLPTYPVEIVDDWVCLLEETPSARTE